MEPLTALAVTTIASKLFGIGRRRKANRAKRRGMVIRQRQAEMQAARNRNQLIRQARIMRAQGIAGAEATGASMSSGAAGLQSSLTSQLFGNLDFHDEQMAMNRQVAQYEQTAASAIGQAQMFDAIGDISSAFFAAKGGWAEFFGGGGSGGKLFSGSTAKGGW